ncbi:MAG: hypothetical protein QW666_00440 [Candidatus Woesearchaeota archaeon]
MAKNEGRNTALILLGIVVIIAVVGLILLFTGVRTGKAYYYPNSGIGVYQYSNTQFYPSAREACLRAVHCQDGWGGVLVSPPEQSPAICVCPEHFFPETVFDWTAVRLGEDPAPRDWNHNYEWKIVWKMQNAMYSTGGARVYESPGYPPMGTYSAY